MQYKSEGLHHDGKLLGDCKYSNICSVFILFIKEISLVQILEGTRSFIINMIEITFACPINSHRCIYTNYWNHIFHVHFWMLSSIHLHIRRVRSWDRHYRQLYIFFEHPLAPSSPLERFEKKNYVLDKNKKVKCSTYIKKCSSKGMHFFGTASRILLKCFLSIEFY